MKRKKALRAFWAVVGIMVILSMVMLSFAVGFSF